MVAQGPLRRWKPFLPAFSSIDAAIVAAEPGLSRVEFRDARLKILEMLRGATDDEVAEELCIVLDGVMIESLRTLEMVPAMPDMLRSTDLAKDVGALRDHKSERVRDLATGIVRGWRASVKDQIVKYVAAMKKVSQVLEPDETDDHLRANILEPSPPKKTATTLEPSFRNKQSTPVAKTTKMEPPREKLPAAAGSFRQETVTACSAGEKARIPLNVAKRKLRESYQEAEDAKRQRTVRVIEAPDMAKQRRRKMHPILGERTQSRCSSSSITRSFSRR
ncbi:probable mediator of RNA polymerase II transcription subunit 26c [Oryza brachyantha]|uniref:probable mediator of RNA polymerase II transcription subunit 26c n=1 Tax=Oryza brachyantha TaxID=4533 RepID=UPI001ADB6E24|nr:probable mediator of RNA polymerase II transcription subunit 26c [Oryza brachyantha]